MTQAELLSEQGYVDRAYARLDAMLSDARAAAAAAAAARESAGPLRDALVESALSRASHLAIGDEALVFGRIDLRDGRTLYIGRAAVYDEEHEPLVTDWRAPAAEPFYRATPGDTMGVVRRRHLMCRGPRVMRIDDELLDHPDEHDGLVLVGEGALLDALGRARTGRMRDIVATIQSEQDAIIRAPLEGALVVQGGPGTGKTAVALHRAAYLLYTHRARLERSGVLIVGPNPIFLRYIDQVLPSLGETATLATAPELGTGERAAAGDPPVVAALKGDPRMADAVARGVANLPRALKETATISYEGVKTTISIAASRRMVELARKRFRGKHNARRGDFSGFVLTYLWNQWRRTKADWIDIFGPEARRHFESTVRSERTFKRAIAAMWPVMSGREFVANLLASPSMLHSAADGVLSEAEQRRLLRAADHPSTDGDAALIDEAEVHLGVRRQRDRRREPEVDQEEQWMVERMLDDLQETEPIIRMARGVFAERYMEQRRSIDRDRPDAPPVRDRFGYVIVDEAQGLSPMQWRMIARRCPSGRMTILGDLGQAGASAPSSWDEVLAHVGAPTVTVKELTINYRTPSEIMDVAARVLALAGAGVTPPRSVRSTGADPHIRVVAESDMPRAAVDAARELSATLPEAKVAIVTAESRVEPIAAELGIDLARLDAAGLLDATVTVLAVEDARGLEFDAVVVAEPQVIVETTSGGLRALYVAMTRPTQALTIVASRIDEPLSSVLSPSPADSAS